MSRDASIETSKQLQAHLLCSSCEQLFNQQGENWLATCCWHSAEDFPLHTILASSKPFGEGPGLTTYDGHEVPEARIHEVAYFGASVFWRAAVHRWGARTEHHIELGPFREPLRQFLLAGVGFPVGLAMMTVLSSHLDAMTNQMMAPPYLVRRQPCHVFRFDAPGLVFFLFAGKAVPAEVVANCTARTLTVGIADDANEMRSTAMAGLMRTTQRKGKLARL